MSNRNRHATLAVLFVLLSACESSTPPDEEASGTELLELAGHRALQDMWTERSVDSFTTDGCSGGMSAAWRVVADYFPEFAENNGVQPPWEACCVTHDRAYHAGGREASAEAGFAARLAADERLRACVLETGTERAGTLAERYETAPEEIVEAYQAIGESMFLAVRLGGAPCSGLPWRWGYGSPQCVVVVDDFQADGDP